MRELTRQAPIRTNTLPEGEYVSVRLERICFADLPGAFGNVSNAWVGVTMLSKLTSDTSLFTQLEEALIAGGPLQESALMRNAYVMPTQKLVTNAGNCVQGTFGTAWMPIEGYDVDKPPRFLALVDLLDSKKYADQLRQVDQFQASANTLAKAVAGQGLDEYSRRFSDVVAKTSDFLKVSLPDRHMLWVEAEIPIRLQAGTLAAPADDQYFVSLFTEPKASALKGKPPAVKACEIQQNQVRDAIGGDALKFRSGLLVTALASCSGSSTYQAPYLVWRVSRARYGGIGPTYWNRATGILTSLETKQQEFEYTSNTQALRAESDLLWKTQQTGVRLLAARQYNEFKRFEGTLVSLVLSLGYSQGSTKDCVKAIANTRALAALDVDQALGAPLEIDRILGRLDSSLVQECGGAAAAVRKELEAVRIEHAALVDDLASTMYEFRHDALCDLFLPIGATVLDTTLDATARCPVAPAADGTCPRSTAKSDMTSWLMRRLKEYTATVKKKPIEILASQAMVDAILTYSKERKWVHSSVTAPTLTDAQLPSAMRIPIARWITNPRFVLEVVDWGLKHHLIDMEQYLHHASSTTPANAGRLPLPACSRRAQMVVDLDKAATIHPALRPINGRLLAYLDAACKVGNAPYVQARADLFRRAVEHAARSVPASRLFRCHSRVLGLVRDDRGSFHYAVVDASRAVDDEYQPLPGALASWVGAYPPGDVPKYRESARTFVEEYFGIPSDALASDLAAFDAVVTAASPTVSTAAPVQP